MKTQNYQHKHKYFGHFLDLFRRNSTDQDPAKTEKISSQVLNVANPNFSINKINNINSTRIMVEQYSVINRPY